MLNCRAIPPEIWSHARESLVLYFLRRHLRSNAEDLAQETLLSIWNRADYTFAGEEDFLKVCYGFARHKLQENYREAKRENAAELEPSLASPQHKWGSQKSTESGMLLRQVCDIGQSQLHEKEWRIIRNAADLDHEANTQEIELGDAGKARVRLHRARKKLAKLVGLD